jgi:flagellar hook-associated protein 2
LNVDLGTVAGVDAAIRFNGGQELNFASNRFTFNNINFALLKEGQTVDITVSPDVDNIVAKIKDFVEKYNAAVGYISEKLGEKRFRDFTPLSDEQKKDMKEKDIEQWEEKAKSGLLHSDSTLFNLYSMIRNQASSIVAGADKYSSLSAIGITTSGWQDQGKLHIDEDKLKTALSDNPEAVMNLFTNTESGTDQGIAVRLYDQVIDSMQRITNTAGTVSTGVDESSLGRELERVGKRIYTLEERLVEVENRYYRQFTAMEQALQQMNAQSQWLAQQFASGSTQ